MKNNKAFTLVEMLVSFTLSMVLIIILFQLIINLKDIYMSSGIKTELLNKQYLMTNKIYTDLTEKKLTSISKCEEEKQNCINLTFSTGETKEMHIDTTEKKISYDNYIIKLDNNSSLLNTYIRCNTITETKKILSINTIIENKNLKNDQIQIKIIYPFNINDVVDEYN